MIRPLEGSELDAAGALLGAAFREDPVFAFIFPDDAARRLELPELLASMLELDARRGAAVLGAFDEGALVGVASVLPPGAHSDGLPAWIPHLWRLRRLVADPAAVLRALTAARATSRLRHSDAHYLHLLGAHPACQGRGIGAALAREVCAKGPVYLETFAPANRAWYAARGFKEIAESHGTGRPPFWTFRR